MLLRFLGTMVLRGEHLIIERLHERTQVRCAVWVDKIAESATKIQTLTSLSYVKSH